MLVGDPTANHQTTMNSGPNGSRQHFQSRFLRAHIRDACGRVKIRKVAVCMQEVFVLRGRVHRGVHQGVHEGGGSIELRGTKSRLRISIMGYRGCRREGCSSLVMLRRATQLSGAESLRRSQPRRPGRQISSTLRP
jgi:hypothetical protein